MFCRPFCTKNESTKVFAKAERLENLELCYKIYVVQSLK